MATVTYFDAADGMFGYAFLGGRYELQSVTPDEITLVLSSPEDPADYPSTVVLGLENIEFFVPTSGPDAGTQVLSGGEITSVSFLDETDALAVQITDIALDAVLVSNWEERDALFEFYDYTVQGGSTFTGSASKDDIMTGTGADTVSAGGSNDFIKDRGGADTYDGGAGYDSLSYGEWFWHPLGQTQGIEVTYTAAGAGSVIGPDGETDTFTGIEEVLGTMLDDTFTGTGTQQFYGFAGDDVFNGGVGERDTVNYVRDAQYGGTAGVTVDLSGAVGTATDGFGNTDTLNSVERVRGTEQADMMIDNANANNNFRGFGGDDIFVFSGGNNFAEGNAGADEYRFVDGATGYTSLDFDPAEDVFRFEGATGLGDLSGAQTAAGFEIYLGDLTVRLNDVAFNELSLSNVEFGVA